MACLGDSQNGLQEGREGGRKRRGREGEEEGEGREASTVLSDY